MVRQLLTRPDAGMPGRPHAANGHVVATCRHPSEAAALRHLQRDFPDRLDVVRLDVTDVKSIEAAARAVKDRHGRVDVLANAAAVLHVPGGMSPETSLARLDEENMMTAYRVNAVGPTLVAKAFAPLLTEATARNAAAAAAAAAAAGEGEGAARRVPESRPAIVANLSARVSSIGDNALGWGTRVAARASTPKVP